MVEKQHIRQDKDSWSNKCSPDSE